MYDNLNVISALADCQGEERNRVQYVVFNVDVTTNNLELAAFCITPVFIHDLLLPVRVGRVHTGINVRGFERGSEITDRDSRAIQV